MKRINPPSIIDALRSTRRESKRDGSTTPTPVRDIPNPCPVCHNSAHLQEDWRPETGYDRRMKQFKCMQGHEHYTVPKHPRNVLDPHP